MSEATKGGGGRQIAAKCINIAAAQHQLGLVALVPASVCLPCMHLEAAIRHLQSLAMAKGQYILA